MLFPPSTGNPWLWQYMNSSEQRRHSLFEPLCPVQRFTVRTIVLNKYQLMFPCASTTTIYFTLYQDSLNNAELYSHNTTTCTATLLSVNILSIIGPILSMGSNKERSLHRYQEDNWSFIDAKPRSNLRQKYKIQTFLEIDFPAPFTDSPQIFLIYCCPSL